MGARKGQGERRSIYKEGVVVAGLKCLGPILGGLLSVSGQCERIFECETVISNECVGCMVESGLVTHHNRWQSVCMAGFSFVLRRVAYSTAIVGGFAANLCQ